MQVTGIGQCSWDYLAVVPGFPRVDTKCEVLEWHEQGGGPVATALVALARLGVSCRFSGVTGDDEQGRKIRESLAKEGIDTSGLVQRENASSQIAFIAIERDTARRTIFWKRPSGEELRTDEVEGDLLSGSSFLLLDGLMSEVSLYTARRARETSIPVMLDAGRARPGMLEVAEASDYVVASEEFARDLGWSLEPEQLQRERKRFGARVLTVTRGEQGSITVAEGREMLIPAFPVRAVDTTGAGDVFHGGYIYGVLQGWTLGAAVTFASALAALKCTKIGGRTGIPFLPEVLGFLRERGVELQ